MPSLLRIPSSWLNVAQPENFDSDETSWRSENACARMRNNPFFDGIRSRKVSRSSNVRILKILERYPIYLIDGKKRRE